MRPLQGPPYAPWREYPTLVLRRLLDLRPTPSLLHWSLRNDARPAGWNTQVVQAGAPKAWAWEVKDLALPRQQAMSDGLRGPWPPRLQIAGAPQNARVAPAQRLPGAELAAQHEAPPSAL
jgi:hypothetical protein